MEGESKATVEMPTKSSKSKSKSGQSKRGQSKRGQSKRDKSQAGSNRKRRTVAAESTAATAEVTFKRDVDADVANAVMDEATVDITAEAADEIRDADSGETVTAAPADVESCEVEATDTVTESAVADDLSDESVPQKATPCQIVEALLFAADAPIAPAKIAMVLGSGGLKEIRLHVELLNERYAEMGSAFRIRNIAGGYQMQTMPHLHGWIAKLHKSKSETKLTGAAMETLSIVAYKQPATRATVEGIRGVSSGEVLNRLRELDLIKIVGRAEDLGRPILYGTTKKFLEVFGLGDLSDLPKVDGALAAATQSIEAAQLATETSAADAASETVETTAEAVESATDDSVTAVAEANDSSETIDATEIAMTADLAEDDSSEAQSDAA